MLFVVSDVVLTIGQFNQLSWREWLQWCCCSGSIGGGARNFTQTGTETPHKHQMSLGCQGAGQLTNLALTFTAFIFIILLLQFVMNILFMMEFTNSRDDDNFFDTHSSDSEDPDKKKKKTKRPRMFSRAYTGPGRFVFP